jgi:hypothetical protein
MIGWQNTASPTGKRYADIKHCQFHITSPPRGHSHDSLALSTMMTSLHSPLTARPSAMWQWEVGQRRAATGSDGLCQPAFAMQGQIHLLSRGSRGNMTALDWDHDTASSEKDPTSTARLVRGVRAKDGNACTSQNPLHSVRRAPPASPRRRCNSRKCNVQPSKVAGGCQDAATRACTHFISRQPCSWVCATSHCGPRGWDENGGSTACGMPAVHWHICGTENGALDVTSA